MILHDLLIAKSEVHDISWEDFGFSYLTNRKQLKLLF